MAKKAMPAEAAANVAQPAAVKARSKTQTVANEGAATVDKVASPRKVAEKKPPVLLTMTDIGDHLASTFDMPKSHAKIYLAEAVALIAKNLRKGNKVRIAGLGVFQVKKRAARKGHSPKTGEPIKIKATKRVGFSVARDLKAKL